MALKFAFAGFRHGHVLSLYKLAKTSKNVEVVAACEEDGPTRQQLQAGGSVDITHDDCERMLATVDCNALGFWLRSRGCWRRLPWRRPL